MSEKMNKNMPQTVRKIDIANACGLSYGTVNNILNDTGLKYAPATIERVKRTAEEMGFVHGNCENLLKANQNRPIPPASGNFATRQEETDRMLYLRNEEMCTNAEIARKVGVTYITVLKRIGRQPKELTRISLTLRDERYARSRQLKHNLLLNKQIERFEQFKQEVSEIGERVTALETQAQRIADVAKAAREQYSSKVVELNAYRAEAEKAAKELGRSLA